MIRTVGHQRDGCFIAVLRQIYLRRLCSGDQLRPVIVVLIVVVVGAIFMTLYQDSITTIWNNIVTKITGLLS
jgi:hypothetical protein